MKLTNVKALGSILASLLLAARVLGELSPDQFLNRIDYRDLGATIGVALADVNLDGRPDIIAAQQSANRLTLLQSTVSTGTALDLGSFGSPVSFPLGESPFRVVLTDLDGDGKPDILAPLLAAGQVAYLRNLHVEGPMTAASWAPQFDIPVRGTPSGVAAGDLDGDDKVDLVVSDTDGSRALLILRNITPLGEENTPKFANPIVLPTGMGPTDPVLADLDGDGKLDLISPDGHGSTVAVFQNLSSPGTLSSESFSVRIDLQAEQWPQTVAVADINGDGKPDIATVNNGAGNVSMFENRHEAGPLTPGSFGEKVTIGGITAHYAIKLADMDLDDKPELLALDGSRQQIVILPNIAKPSALSTMTFGSPVFVSTGETPVGLTVADLNLNGSLDLVTANLRGALFVGSTVIENQARQNERAPKIVSQPLDTIAAEDGSAAMHATVLGQGPFTYQWRRNGVDLPSQNAPVLLIRHLAPEVAGRYSIVIQNAFGTVESSSALLTVVPRPTELSIQDVSGPAGGEVRVPVQIMAGGNEHSVAFSLQTVPGTLIFLDASLGSQLPSGSTWESDLSQAEHGRTGLRILLPAGLSLEKGLQTLATVSYQIAATAQRLPTPITFIEYPTPLSSRDATSAATQLVTTPGNVSITKPSSSTAPVPLNDDLRNAQEIPASLTHPMVVLGTTLCSSREPGEPSHSGWPEATSVWFTWVADSTGERWIDLEGEAPDPLIIVYRGDTFTNLVAIGNSFSHVFPTTKGERYYLVATDVWRGEGPVKITITPPPLNDDLANAAVLPGTDGTVHVSTRSASFEEGEIPRTGSVWWKWTSPSDGTFVFTTADTSEMSVVSAVYVGDTVRQLQKITDGTTVQVQAGVTYKFRLSGGDSASNQRGNLIMRYGFRPAAGGLSNDRFVNRILLTELTNRIRADNLAASSEPFETGEFNPACYVGRTLWWRYVAPSHGVLRIGATAHGQSMLVDVFKGDEPEHLVRLASSCVGTLLLDAQAGDSFEFRIDQVSRLNAQLPFDLEVDFILPPANDSFADGPELTADAWDLTGHNFKATAETGEPLAEGAAGRTIWYHWVAPFTARAVLSVLTPDTSPNVRVFVGSSPNALQPVRLINQANTPAEAFLAVAGRRYSIQIDSPWSATFHTYLAANPLGPIVNDSFADATPLPGNQFVSLLGASLEPGEPLHFDWPNQKSTWVKWDSYRRGRLTLATDYHWSLSPGFGLAAYLGDDLASAQLIARGTNSISIDAESEKTYHIAVVSPEEVQGDAVILYDWQPKPYPPPTGKNLICSGSFEGDPFNVNLTCWSFIGALSGYINERGGFDGGTWPVLPYLARLWQEFPTEPGRPYELRFAFTGIEAAIRVLWDNRELGVFHYNSAPSDWYYVIRTAVASNSTSRLTFESLGGGVHLDAIRVTPMNEPPRIIEPPTSQSVTMGGTVAFQLQDMGSSPLAYQWFFNQAPLLGKTNRVLVIDAAQDRDVGDYFVVITNAFGSASSAPVQLAVEAPVTLALTMQPQSATVPAGTFLALGALAAGPAPITYQWLFEGEPLVGATNRHLVFGEITSTNAGSYQLRASNGTETVISLPAQVRVTESLLRGSFITFRNRFLRSGSVVEIPIYDVDGVTRLSGNSFVAQLYAGLTLSELHAIGQPVSFGIGGSSGIFQSTTLPLPTSGPGSRAQVQVRVWQAAVGASYEEARALGGKFGKSEVFEVPAEPMQIPPNLDGLTGFSLQAGLPRLNVGVIRLVSVSPANETTWALMGEKGFRYLIERSESDFVWRPWLVLTNSSGETLFRDTIPEELTGPRFYRSRILD